MHRSKKHRYSDTPDKLNETRLWFMADGQKSAGVFTPAGNNKVSIVN
jgi:hypothetical protein